MGKLTLCGHELQCANLADGRRVISTTAFLTALGRARPGGQTYERRRATGRDQLPVFLASERLRPFIPSNFSVATIRYSPVGNGPRAEGVDADAVPMICKIWVDAWTAGALLDRQLPTAYAAAAINNALAHVGIIALIDEVTGYQADRAREELQKILKAYVCPEMLPWLQRFPSEFFKETYKIMGWEYKEGTAARPGFVGTIINDWIYKRLPAPVLPELCKVNPVIDGHRRRKHHQHLTRETGIPHLDRQISHVTMLMRVSTDRRMFEELLVRAFPVSGDQMPLGTATTA